MTSEYPPPPPPEGQPQQTPAAYPSYSAYGDGGSATLGYPQGGNYPNAAAAQPPSIKTAVMLMRVGAALSLLGIVVTLLTLGSLKDNIRSQLQDNANFTQSDIDTSYNLVVGSVIVVGLLGVALWLWMAQMNGKGRKWARIVATALGALSVLSFVLALGQGQATSLSLLVSGATALLAIVILVLLWRQESTNYYNAQKPRPS